MDKLITAIFTISLLTVTTNGNKGLELVQLPKLNYEIGERILLECIDHTWQPNQRPLLKWQKQEISGWINDTSVSEEPIGVSANKVLRPAFRNSYYVADIDNKDGKLRFSFEIKTAGTNDSGLYTCSDANLKQSVKIIVSSEPQVRWNLKEDADTESPLDEDSILTYKEGEEVPIMCFVTGAFPEPKTEIYAYTLQSDIVGPSTMVKKTPLTHLFENQTTRHDSSLFHIVLSSPANSPLLASFHLHKKRVECSAEIPGKTPFKAGFNVELTQYKPYFNCDDKMRTKLGSKNYSISCVVHALPEVKDTKIFLVNADKRTQLIGEENGEKDYTVQVEPVEHDPELIEVTLTIRQVKKSHLTKYEFIASNDLGETKHIISLVEGLSELTAAGSKSTAPIMNFSILFHCFYLFAIIILSYFY